MRLLDKEDIESLRNLRIRLLIIEATALGLYGNWWIDIMKEFVNFWQGILFQFSFLLLVVYLLGVIPIKKQHDKISYWSSPKSNNLIFIIHLLFVYIPLLFEADMIDPTNKKILYNLTGFFILIFIWVVGQKLCEIPDLK